MSFSPEEIAEMVQTTDNGHALSALACFDYTLTFTREVERIWKREFSTPVILFYLVRYPAMVSALLLILNMTGWQGISDKYTFVRLNIFYAISSVGGSCEFAPDMPEATYEK
ncbi:hypothetical protein TRAPUB_9167 [Trametes pubescens]|uniref:DUF6533 domain-containing protein n=1 Tax=Trametes pubescens TaxID=154538 RepID=A0A1M2W3C3_TRAPU|nr:hypothetical protein TRAPUB_9167 [Trametes pubescens]